MLVLLFCKLSEQYSQTNFPIIKPFNVTKKGGGGGGEERQIFIIIIICYIYIALFWVLKSLYIEGGGGSPPPPPVCSIHLDNATAAILRHNAHHTPAYWWRGDKEMMGIIRRPWWSEANLGQSGRVIFLCVLLFY